MGIFDKVIKVSRRKQLTGKRVRLVRHGGPELHMRVGTISDVTNNGQVVQVGVDAIPAKVINNVFIHRGAPATFITMSIKGVELL